MIDPLRNEEGAVTGQVATRVDVTNNVLAQKKAEASEAAVLRAKNEAEKMERLCKTITGSTPGLVYVFDLNYRFAYANPALLSM